jgi:hypothetical protein
MKFFKIITPALLFVVAGCSNARHTVAGSPKPPTRHKVLSVAESPTGGKLVRLSGFKKDALMLCDTLKVGDSITVNWIKGRRF